MIYDIDYGLAIKVPDNWISLAFGQLGFWIFKHPSLEIFQIVCLLRDKPNAEKLIENAKHVFMYIYSKQPDTVKLLEYNSDSSNFKLRIFSNDHKYIWQGFIIRNIQSFNGTTWNEEFLSTVLYNEEYLRTNKEAIIAKTILRCPFTKKTLDSFGWRTPFIKISFTSRNVLGDYELRWIASVPITFNIQKSPLGFTAYTNRVFVRIQAIHYFYSPTDLADFAKRQVEGYLNQLLRISTYIILSSTHKENFCHFYVTDEKKSWKILGEWYLQEYYNLKTKKIFYMVLEKVAIYPARIEKYFLPIVGRIFASFLTGAAWLQEETGILDLMIETSIKSISRHETQIKKSEKLQTRTFKVSSTEKMCQESFLRKWQQKLKEDMKKLYEWERKLWNDVYDTLKFSDMLTGMYSMKDKRRKTKIISTKNIVSPITCNLWKPKDDVIWLSRLTLATSKHRKPRNPYLWEKLKWYWDEEKKRLEKEIEKKKQEIDKLF